MDFLLLCVIEIWLAIREVEHVSFVNLAIVETRMKTRLPSNKSIICIVFLIFYFCFVLKLNRCTKILKTAFWK